MLSNKPESAAPSFWSSTASEVSRIFSCISCSFSMSIASVLSSAIELDILASSVPSLTTRTFFSSFAHQRVPSLNLNRGEAHAGQANSVSVAP